MKKKRKVFGIGSIVLLCIVLWFGYKSYEMWQAGTGENLNQIELNLEKIQSKYVYLEQRETQEELLDIRAGQKMYPASLVKAMTVFVALEYLDDIEQSIAISEEIHWEMVRQNASVAGFWPGEQVPVRDMLYGILLPSGGESCLAVAEYVAGSEQAFVELMNQKAAEIGMTHTNFTNSTGLHDKQQYSTVRDMAKLLSYALQNEEFRNIFTSRQYSTTATETHPDGVMLFSTLFANLPSVEITNGEIIGGKTGYTPEAQLCLMSLAVIEGQEYILVTAYAEGSHQTQPFHILDAVNIYNQIGEVLKQAG